MKSRFSVLPLVGQVKRMRSVTGLFGLMCLVVGGVLVLAGQAVASPPIIWGGRPAAWRRGGDPDPAGRRTASGIGQSPAASDVGGVLASASVIPWENGHGNLKVSE